MRQSVTQAGEHEHEHEELNGLTLNSWQQRFDVFSQAFHCLNKRVRQTTVEHEVQKLVHVSS